MFVHKYICIYLYNIYISIIYIYIYIYLYIKLAMSEVLECARNEYVRGLPSEFIWFVEDNGS